MFLYSAKTNHLDSDVLRPGRGDCFRPTAGFDAFFVSARNEDALSQLPLRSVGENAMDSPTMMMMNRS